MILHLGKQARYACLACGKCKGGEGCIIGDTADFCHAADIADGIIFATPTHYGGASGNLTSLLSRLLYSSKESFMHKPIASIGVGRRGCIYGAVNEINKFFYFTSSPIVTCGYPPIVYGTSAASAELDGEGMQNARAIARNMHWLACCIASGKANGINPPPTETKIATDISTLARLLPRDSSKG